MALWEEMLYAEGLSAKGDSEEEPEEGKAIVIIDILRATRTVDWNRERSPSRVDAVDARYYFVLLTYTPIR
jgi:hypothetical protein